MTITIDPRALALLPFELRVEIAMLWDRQQELASLRRENERLRAAQPAAAQLEALRADHAAVARLRDEIEATREKLAAREKALAAGVR